MRLLITSIFLLAWLPSSAFAWWNDAWPYRAPIALDTTVTGANLNESLNEVPVLIRLHAGNFQDFFVLKEDLADLRFIAGDDKTPLKHHVEYFDLINQMLFIWVKVPQLTSGINTEKVWMYYGNEEAVSNADSGGTYDVNQVLVHHFEESAGLPEDNSAYGNNVERITAALSPTSLIGPGLKFDGNGMVVLSDNPALRFLPDSGMTMSVWVKPVGTQQDAHLVYRSDSANTLSLNVDQAALYARLIIGDENIETPRTAPLTPDVWQHVAVAITNERLSVFINGIEMAATDIVLPEMGGPIFIGSSPSGENAFVGEMDELHIANTVRSAAWLQAASKNQGQQNQLLFVDEAEQLGNAGGTSTFMAILHHANEDKFGLAVIIILIIMSIVSLLVMLMKWLYLGRVIKDNKKFLEAYYNLGTDDPAQLDREEDEEDTASQSSPITQAVFGKHDHFQSSPLYHMYHRGIKEVKVRIGGGAAVGADVSQKLNARSTESIRASMDAFMVREMQKLNSKMVILTIAISGGPFIGLLGTVVGVMITFAAIAAAGDVNINAIAPGMSAALLATVAGLAVAIPALFGYNYLGSQIKDITADMRVFVDEFVTKMAEYYS